tara:strand:+ start:1244 stop:1663 length:420 start_codon:yes stop_codon:yes gene_type:complete
MSNVKCYICQEKIGDKIFKAYDENLCSAFCSNYLIANFNYNTACRIEKKSTNINKHNHENFQCKILEIKSKSENIIKTNDDICPNNILNKYYTSNVWLSENNKIQHSKRSNNLDRKYCNDFNFTSIMAYILDRAFIGLF